MLIPRDAVLPASTRRAQLAVAVPTQSVSREAEGVFGLVKLYSRMQTRTFVALSLLTTAAALQLTRRDLAQAIGIGAATTLAPVANAADIKACSKGANNCWSTASTDKTSLKPWTFPGKKGDAVKQLRAALEAYPQAGAGQC